MERLELSNSLPQTTTWIYMGEDGRLTIEWYDYSPEAEQHLGGDAAFLLYVDEAGQRQIRELLGVVAPSPGREGEDALLQRLQQRFGSYHEIKSWLIDNNVPLEAAFDSNA